MEKGTHVQLANGQIGVVVQEIFGQVAVDVEGHKTVVPVHDVKVVEVKPENKKQKESVEMNVINNIPGLEDMPEAMIVAIVKGHREGNLTLDNKVLFEIAQLAQTKYPLPFGDLGDINRLATQLHLLNYEWNGEDKVALSTAVTVARHNINRTTFGMKKKIGFQEFYEIKGALSINPGFSITHVSVSLLEKVGNANKMGHTKIGKMTIVIGGLHSEVLDLMKDENGKLFARNPWSNYQDKKTKKNKFYQKDKFFEAGSVDAVDTLQYLLGELAGAFTSWAADNKINIIRRFVNSTTPEEEALVPNIFGDTKTEDTIAAEDLFPVAD